MRSKPKCVLSGSTGVGTPGEDESKGVETPCEAPPPMKAPADFDLEAFERAVLKNPQVLSMHQTYSWSIDGESHVLTTQLVMRRDANREHIKDAKDEVRRMLDRDSFEHVTIDVELGDEACVLNHALEGQDESADHRL